MDGRVNGTLAQLRKQVTYRHGNQHSDEKCVKEGAPETVLSVIRVLVACPLRTNLCESDIELYHPTICNKCQEISPYLLNLSCPVLLRIVNKLLIPPTLMHPSITMANCPASMMPIWRASVHKTAFIPP